MRLTTHYLLLVVGAVLFLYATSCGLGITYDSRQYLAAARSLLQNGTLRTADGTAYAHWPPLYPAWLAVWGAAETVKYAHLAVWLVTLSFAQRFGQKMLKTPFAQTFFLLTLVFGTPLFLVQVFAWSEGLFVLLTVLVFVFFRKFTETERKRHLFWMLLFSNLLCLQRLTGMFFVAGFGLLLWQARQNAKLTLMYVSVSLTSVTLWMLRNTCVETEPSFVGDLFVVSPLVSVKNHLSAIGNWFVPQAVPVAVKAAIVLSVGLALAFCGWRAERTSFLRQTAVLGIVYLGATVLAAGEPSEADRFVAPGYLWMAAALCVLADQRLGLLQKQWQRWAAMGLLAVWLLYPVIRTISNAVFWHQSRCLNPIANRPPLKDA